jgi:hypothetical protein
VREFCLKFEPKLRRRKPEKAGVPALYSSKPNSIEAESGACGPYMLRGSPGCIAGASLETGFGETSGNKVHNSLYEALQYEGSLFRKNLFCAATQRHQSGMQTVFQSALCLV